MAREARDGKTTTPPLLEIIERGRAAFADVPEEEFDREVDRALAEVRREMAAERKGRERS